MPTPVEAISEAIAAGVLHRSQLLPPVPAELRTTLVRLLTGPVPRDIDELWQTCSGLVIGADTVDFTGSWCRHVKFPLREFDTWSQDAPFTSIIGHALPLLPDDFGNHWAVEISAEGRWGPVWYQWNSPFLYAIAATDLGAFLAEGLVLFPARKRRWPGDIVPIAKDNPHARDSATLFDAPDAVLRDFARAIGPGHDVFDLRSGMVGCGFRKEGYMSITKHPSQRIFSGHRVSRS